VKVLSQTSLRTMTVNEGRNKPLIKPGKIRLGQFIGDQR
jgi:hypothetical protein